MFSPKRFDRRSRYIPPSAALWWLLPCLLLLGSCIDPIDAPSAFSTEQYLCDDEHAAEFNAMFEQCRQDHVRDDSCAVVLSLGGVFDSQPVVLDASVLTANYVDMPSTELSITRVIAITARAPCFALRLDVIFAVPPAVTPSGSVPDVACPAVYVNACAASQILNLEARGGNYLAGLTMATREMKLETPDEIAASVKGKLSRGGSIDACFHVFPQAL